MSFCVIEALKDICDVGSPDKIITDNAHYFVSEEFTKFMMDWSIQHLMSSPRFPYENAHTEKTVGIVKELYAKCHGIKLGLLLLKTTPVSNGHHSYQAPVNVFFGHQLKANLPIYFPSSSQNTCTLDAKSSASSNIDDVPPKFQVDQDVWVKDDPHTKWMAGKITQILPNQSYMTRLLDGQVFCRNEHHIRKRQSCLKPSMNSEVIPESHSYNLRLRKNTKSVRWPDICN